MRLSEHMKMLTGACLFTFASSVSAGATTLDFSGAVGDNGTTLVLTEATLNNLGGGVVLGGVSAALEADGFCFTNVGVTNCESDGEILFTDAVFDLTFDADAFDTGDSVQIDAFLGVSLLGSIIVTADGFLDFSGFGNITRLFFDDSSTGAGFGWSTFSFDVVPLPAALPIFAASIGVFGLLGWRRKRKIAAAV